MIIKTKWFGTASYILDFDGIRLFFDPFFFRNENSAPILKSKKEDIKNISAIFISHGHFDHISDAGWFAENLNVPIYCSEAAKNTIIRWAEGKILPDHSHPLSERAKNKIKSCNSFDTIKITKDISVEFIKSEHIKFDLNTIFSRLFSWKFLKQMGAMIPYGKGFPMGTVFGFCTYYKDKKIVSFGSLWHEYTEILKKYQNCDIFFAPLAGNSKQHLAKKGGRMVELLKPKIVIPIHWDNFFPPISRAENLNPFFKYMERIFPHIEIKILPFDEEIILELD